jgi:hypothetical protein
MNIYPKNHLVLLLAALVLLLHIAPAQGQAGNQYTLIAGVISSDGGTQSGGQYSVAGVAGQAVSVTATGDHYTITGDFWTPPPPPDSKIYLPLVNR